MLKKEAYYEGPIFTLARSNAEDRPELLFINTTRNEDFNEEDIETIAESSLVKKLLGDSFILVLAPQRKWNQRYRWNSDPKEHDLKLNVLHVTPDVSNLLINRLDEPYLRNAKVWLRKSDGTLKAYVPNDVHNYCPSPAKYVMSCEDCMRKGEFTACEFSKFASYISEDFSGMDNFDAIRSKLIHRKTKVGPYLFVSASMTHPGIEPYLRPAREHYFEVVESVADIRRKANLERTRFNKFKKAECANCMLHNTCHTRLYDDYFIRYCSGKYEGDEKTIASRMVDKVTIPYTPTQLRYLTLNSGILNKRVNRCKYTATFKLFEGPYYDTTDGTTTSRPTLLFGIHRTLLPGQCSFMPIRDFDDAVRLLNGKKDYVIPKDRKYFNTVQTATLLQLCHQQYSVARGGWGCTSYPRAFTTYDRLYDCFKSYHYYPHSSITANWTTVAAKNLKDVYIEYKRFMLEEKSVSPLRR